MAREAIYKMRVDTGSSVQDIQSFEQGLNDTTAAINKNTDAAKDMNATFEQVYGELQPLTTRLGEAEDRLYELALAGDTTSKEYQNLLETVARYRQTQIQTDMVVDQASKTFSEKLTGSVEGAAAVFQGFESVTALMGVENEALIQTMVRLQAVQGAVNAVQVVSQKIKERDPLLTGAMTAAQKIYTLAVGTSTGAMKALRIALMASGIGILLAAVGAAVALFSKFQRSTEEITKENRKLTASFDRNTEAINQERDALQRSLDTRIRFAEASGKTEEEIAKIREKGLEDVIANNEKEIKNTQAKLQFLESEEYKARLGTQASSKEQFIELDNLRKQEVASAKKRLGELGSDNNKARLEIKLQSIKLKTEENQELAEKDKEARQKAAEDFKTAQQERLQQERERIKNILAIRDEFFAQLEEAENAYYDSLLTDQQREEQAVNDKFFSLIEQAKQYGADTSILEAAQAKELADIRKRFDDDRLAKIKENEEQKLALLRSYQEVVLDEYAKELVDFEDAQAEQSKALSEALAKGVITEQQFMDAQLKLEEAYAQKEIEINKKKNDAITEANTKRWEEETKNIQKALEFAQMGLDQLGAVNDLLNQLGENRITAIQEQQDAELASLEEKQSAALDNENLTAEQRTQIEQDFAQQKYQVQLKAFNEEDKIKRAQFARDKALRIAQASIDTAAAVIKSIAQGGGIPTGLPFGIAAAALGATQIATIAAQKYQGGSAPTPPSLSGGVTGAGASSFQANDNANLNTEETNLSNIAQNAPISQVVVLESDITGTQNKVMLQEKLSTF